MKDRIEILDSHYTLVTKGAMVKCNRCGTIRGNEPIFHITRSPVSSGSIWYHLTCAHHLRDLIRCLKQIARHDPDMLQLLILWAGHLPMGRA